jgi:hypothetical protein
VKPKRNLRKNIELVVLLIIIGVGLLVINKRLALSDWLRLYDYTPSSAIANLATEDTMTPYARHLFYVYHPTLEDSTEFNRDCTVSEQAIVLGCTVIGQGIYLYQVDNVTLNGVEQVTAAHEMLHVAYSRLSTKERNYIDGLVMSTYNKLSKSDPLLGQEEQDYLKTEGQGAVANELHSVLGTEVANLPPALENYYKQYFSDRQTIVNYATSYESVFTNAKQEISADDTQLSSWQTTIKNNEATLTSEDQQIDSQRQTLVQLQSSGQTSQYNSEVSAFNESVSSYNNLATATRQLINQYNQLVETRNNIATQEDQLVNSISSLPSTIPTQ